MGGDGDARLRRRAEAASAGATGPDFVAIDFETANTSADSACSVGLVKVVSGAIVETAVHLIRPPTRCGCLAGAFLSRVNYSSVPQSPKCIRA